MDEDRRAADQGAAAEPIMSPSTERDDPYQGIIAAVLSRELSDVGNVLQPGQDAGVDMLDGEGVDDEEDAIQDVNTAGVQQNITAPNIRVRSTNQSPSFRRSARTQKRMVDRYTPPPDSLSRPGGRRAPRASGNGSRRAKGQRVTRDRPTARRAAVGVAEGPRTRGSAKRERVQSGDERELQAAKAPRRSLCVPTPVKLAPPEFSARTMRRKKRSSSSDKENVQPAKRARQSNQRAERRWRRKYQSKPLFALHGLGQEKKLQATQMLSKMGIKTEASGPYDPSTTHIVVSSLARNAKTLCGMAAGAWIVGPDFISSCEDASDITEESGFELQQADNNGISDGAPKHWRTRCENLGTKAFAGVKAIFYGTFDGPGTNALESIITSGGGCVLRKTAPFTNILEQGVANVAIIGSDRVRDRTTKAFRTAGLTCVKPEYIIDWVTHPAADLAHHCLFGCTPTPELKRMETARSFV